MAPRETHVEQADRALTAYQAAAGSYTRGDEETLLADLLADLMHWADTHNPRDLFDSAIARATSIYEGDSTEPDFDSDEEATR